MESSDRTLEVRFDIETKQTTGFVSLVHTEMGLHTSRVSIVAGLTSVSSTVAAVAAGQRGRLVPVFHIHRLKQSICEKCHFSQMDCFTDFVELVSNLFFVCHPEAFDID